MLQSISWYGQNSLLSHCLDELPSVSTFLLYKQCCLRLYVFLQGRWEDTIALQVQAEFMFSRSQPSPLQFLLISAAERNTVWETDPHIRIEGSEIKDSPNHRLTILTSNSPCSNA